jgi:F0F1-type ATP synthase membrane subunit c/vacuolar-type H+-ATPase subunit K
MVAFKTQTKEVNPAVVLAISCVAASGIGIGFFYRSRLFPPLAEAFAKDREDAAASRKWFIGVVLSCVFCETTILFGLVLRILGTSWDISGIFFIAGILLLLAWTPKLDLPSSPRS